MNQPNELSPIQNELAEAIHADFVQTYPGTPLQRVYDEMLSQLQGNPPKNGILGGWIQDHLLRLSG